MKLNFFHCLVSLFGLVDARLVMVVYCLWQRLMRLSPLRVVAVHNEISISFYVISKLQA